ncbi:cellulose binding domain-containing protein [Archangium violaceum]|uniref:glycosyl hydrolase family 18 protein n=1 Tax=Archangium violaceum TaxID=83451 RepID=UPI00193C20A0|nr:glycosyl hydrolase family 18 protein [Archangium violaceum]QRK08297.1 cellulose binding domain-containing protein [Archangium violaceum]
MRQSRKFFVSALLGSLVACGGQEPQTSSNTQSQELAASAAGLTATLNASSSWEGGFNGVVTIKNTTSSPITDWAVTLKFNGNAAISGSPWGAGGSATRGSDGSWTLLPNTWGGNVVPANGSVTVTFSGTGTYTGVSSCTINGYACDGSQPHPGDDTTPPTVGLSASPTNLTSAGSVSLSAPASDNVGVAKVEFYRNGTLLSTDTSSPFSASDAFNSSTQNGTYGYTARAYDAAGNTTTSSVANVTVNITGEPPPPGGRMYIGYASSWNTSINDLTTANIPSYYTHLNLSFVRPNTAYQRGSYEFDQAVAGLEFFEGATTNTGQKKFTPEQARTLINNIRALRARGTQVWLSVGGWSYSQGSQWAEFSAPHVVDLAQDLEVDGIDIDWESSGSSCNKLPAAQFSCSKDGEIANIITSLDSTIRARGLKLGISIAGWSTGAYYVAGTPFEEGKVQWGSPFGGTMYNVVKNHGNKLHHINLMSYDGGDYYDPREGYESYRAIYSGPIAMGLEIAPEGAGGATLKLNAEPGTVYDAEMLTGQNNMATKYYNVETLATYIKNKGKPTDGMMVWQIWKERVHATPPAGAATVNATGQKVCQILGITSNCNQSLPELPKY